MRFPEAVPSLNVTLCATPPEFHCQVTVPFTATAIGLGEKALLVTETVLPPPGSSFSVGL